MVGSLRPAINQAAPPDHRPRIHFGFSKSKYYKRALALAAKATLHETRGRGEDAWHIVTFTDNQMSQMALLFSLTRLLHPSRISGVEVGHLHRFAKNGTVYAQYAHLSANVKKRVQAVAKSRMRVQAVAERLMADMKIGKRELTKFLDDTYLTPIRQDSTRVLSTQFRNALFLPK